MFSLKPGGTSFPRPFLEKKFKSGSSTILQ